MKHKFDRLVSFVVAFVLTLLGILYYGYLQNKEQDAVNGVFSAIEIVSNAGIELGYKDLSIVRNPGYIDFKASDLDFLSAENSASAKNAELMYYNQESFKLKIKDALFAHGYGVGSIDVEKLNQEIKIVFYNLDFKGIVFDEVEILARVSGNYLEVSQLILKSKDLSVVAQGGCEFDNIEDYRCKLNTSSKGLIEFLAAAEEKDIFTSRGVYVATLVLKTQTSQRTIASIEANPKGFYIKNILMTSEKKS